MLRTVVLTILGLALAAGIPFAYYTLSEQGTISLSSLTNGLIKLGGGPEDKAPAASSVAAPKVSSTAIAFEQPPIRPLDQVLRFDITPDWVLGAWPRVMTGLGQIQLKGYRVPLVTGTAEDDLAGSLTYYFDPHSRLQRIIFHGTTGNPQKLLGVLTSQYGFARHVLNHPGVIVYEVPGEPGQTPRSTLSVESAEIIKATEPYLRYRLSMVLERPEIQR